MLHQIAESAQAHGKGAGPDRNVGLRYAHHIDEQRHRQHRAAAADQAEGEADEAAGGKDVGHADLGLASHSRPFSIACQ